MANVASGGAGGTGSTQSGASGGNANQAGGSVGDTSGGAAGTSPGGNGGDGSITSSSGGAGGGGGADGGSNSPTGGSGGNGSTLEAFTSEGLGGGGGGGGGAGLVVLATMTLSHNAAGGAGGNGSDGIGESGQYGDGGSGGGGGSGLVLSNSGLTITIDASNGFGGAFEIVGGAGGGGGYGSGDNTGSAGNGGNGGDGGDGIFASDGDTVINAGTIEGGAAGAGNFGDGGSGPQSGIGRGTNGAAGAYGSGIIGSDLTVTNSGAIAGGLDPSSYTVRGNALTFTGGTNTLTLSSGGTVGTLNGNISVKGSLDVKSGGTASTLGGFALVFGAAGAAVTIESGVTLADTVSGFMAGDTLDMKGVAYSSALEAVFTDSATGGSLRIVNAAHPTNVVESLTLSGTYTSGVFGLSSDGNGGTSIGFTKTPSLGMQPNDVATSSIPGSSALVVVDRYNADYSLYQGDTITVGSNGNYTFHFAGGSFFNGKSFSSFDNVTNSSGLLLNQTLYDANGNSTEYTTFNANGTIYQQALISRPAAGEILYHYDAGTFFTNKPYSAFDNLATTGGTLLDQILYNNDGSHTFTVPGSNLTLTAQKNDTFNVSGSNDTTRFNATGFGADTFNGYKSGDIFSFSTSIFANYAALQQHLSGTSNAIITTNASDTLTLANVAKSSVTSSMFTFT